MSDAPRIVPSDQLTPRIRYAVLFERVKPSSLAKVLRDAVDRMNGSGDDAEMRYQQALAALREADGDAIDALSQELAASDEGNYVNRWVLVQLLSDLQDPRALRVLHRVVGSPLPENRSLDPHGSAAARELVVRTAAVEGIARLAGSGSTEARDALFGYLSHPVRSIRIAAVLACVEQGGDRARKEVRRRLPKSDQWMLDIRRVHPREVPPIEGHRFLPPKSPPEKSAVPSPFSGYGDTQTTTQPASVQPPAAEPPTTAPRSRPGKGDTPSKRRRAGKQKKG